MAAERDLAGLSDEELRRMCAPKLVERTFGDHVPYVVFELFALGMTFAILRFAGLLDGRPDPWRGKVALLSFAGAAWLLVATRVSGTRRKPLRAELRRRYGLAPFGDYVDEELRALSDGAPDVTLLFTCRYLPHGAVRWIRARIWRAKDLRSQPRVEVEFRTAEGSTTAEIETRALFRAKADLTPQEHGDLLRLVEKEAVVGSVDAQPVRDGAPCSLAVIRRGPHPVQQVAFNLAGVMGETPAVVQLARALLETGEAVRAKAKEAV